MYLYILVEKPNNEDYLDAEDSVLPFSFEGLKRIVMQKTGLERDEVELFFNKLIEEEVFIKNLETGALSYMGFFCWRAEEHGLYD